MEREDGSTGRGRDPGREAGTPDARLDTSVRPDEGDVPVYLPCAKCSRAVRLLQARAASYLAGAVLCADCLPF